jgi:hypothetical protein
MPSDEKYCRAPIVAVPARNEEDRLPTLIEALGRQTWLAKSGRNLQVVVVLNNCADRSAAALAGAAARYPALDLDVVEVEFSPKEAHVGFARRLAMNRALELGSSHSVLLTTDADAAPLPNWIDANLAAIDDGADIVGGHIVGDQAEERQLGPRFLRRAACHLRYSSLVDRLAALIDPLPHDPWPRHSDHTGASLAVRGDVYAAVGGMAPLPSREDLAFVNRVRRAGYHLRHPLDVCVKVSARLEGRAMGGMANCLKLWLSAEQQGLPHLVEDPRSVVDRLRRRRLCRELAAGRALHFGDLIEPFGSEVFSGLGRTGQRSPRRGTLIDIVAPDEPDAPGSVEVVTAIGQIERMIADRQKEIHVS